ncbi:MAG TPA: glycoside hydrolase family 57 protein [Prolixibacteraceae bacterium]|nr:glycoside hydrolase family 57 protein [Prolixibacteraceae bacterium]
MKTVCLNFQIHQPFRYRKYRFFDIGNDAYYYDDFANETTLRKATDHTYLPANKIILEQILKYKGKFKVTYSLSGVVLDQFKLYAPEVIESFAKLAATGCVEFLSETYANSLVSMADGSFFESQVKAHDDLIEELFGQRPKVFRNTELIYSDEIGDLVQRMGFEAMITEGAKHILGWKSPNYLYCNALNPRLKVLMRNYRFSDDLSFRFSNKAWNEFPLTAEKYAGWINSLPKEEEVVTIFINYETFGQLQPKSSGIFDFLKKLPEAILKSGKLSFSTPSEVINDLQPVSAVHVPYPISWADEERDLSAWLGNELQKEAFDKLYQLKDRMRNCTDATMLKDWDYLQTNDHFYYMCTKFFSDGEVHKYFNPYSTPYEAFINYMNVLSDFKIRLNAVVPKSAKDQEIANLKDLVNEKTKKLELTEIELKKVKKEVSAAKLSQDKIAVAAKVEPVKPAGKAVPKKTAPKKPIKKGKKE